MFSGKLRKFLINDNMEQVVILTIMFIVGIICGMGMVIVWGNE